MPGKQATAAAMSSRLALASAVNRLPCCSTISTGRPARSTSQLPGRRRSGRVPPSSSGMSNGAPEPYRLAGSRLCSRTSGAAAVDGKAAVLQQAGRFRQGELRSGQPLDEVAAPHLAGQLHPAQHFVQDAPGQHPRIEQAPARGPRCRSGASSTEPERRRAPPASGWPQGNSDQRPSGRCDACDAGARRCTRRASARRIAVASRRRGGSRSPRRITSK